ncbi:hypothetical protein VNO77_05661 [Canavalia gladiata]|uniref:Uncharacterized protein n=1 Tax=Canavalia gladiata TaxID=3824 RepID=A0AAN9N406_CANGL
MCLSVDQCWLKLTKAREQLYNALGLKGLVIMGSEKADTCSRSSNEGIYMEENVVTNGKVKSNMEKEVARRALLRSHLRRNGRKKIGNNTAKLLPSRLSRVSLAEDSAQ